MCENVNITIKNNIAILSLNNPPLNSLNLSLRKEMIKKLSYCEKKNEVKVICLKGSGKNFSVGADIKEFSSSSIKPSLSEICNKIENSKKPIFAFLTGYVLGGGLEIAISAHYRIALKNAFFGFPEVNLGLLPGAGGTQRLPRLIGVKKAIKMMIEGKTISSEKALKLKLVDKIVLFESDNIFENLYLILKQEEELIKKNMKINSFAFNNNRGYQEIINSMKQEIHKKSLKKKAQLEIINCVNNMFSLDFKTCLYEERKAFSNLKRSKESKSLIYDFFSKRKSLKIPEIICKDSSKIIFKKIGILGAGIMGKGIAFSCLMAGLEVYLYDVDTNNLIKTQKKIFSMFEDKIIKNQITKKQKQDFLNSFKILYSSDDLSSVDLVIEAINEDLDLKKKIIFEMDNKLPKNIYFATNTSYLSIKELASVTAREDKFIGLHFFSPANIMKLVEVIVTKKVSNEYVHACFNFVRSLNKLPIRSLDSTGFIGNSILSNYSDLIFYLVEDGVSPYKIDEIFKNFGYPIGFHQMVDLAGGDVSWSNRKRKNKIRNKNARYVNIPDKLCELGRLGQKTGKGYYIYPNKNSVGIIDSEVLKIIENERIKKKIKQKNYSDEDILKRIIASIVNQASNLLMDKVALRPSDIDLVLVYGYGFPKIYCGPMKYADNYGLCKILSDIKEFSKENIHFWKPSKLLIDLVKDKKDFKYLNDKLKFD